MITAIVFAFSLVLAVAFGSFYSFDQSPFITVFLTVCIVTAAGSGLVLLVRAARWLEDVISSPE